MKYTRDLIIFGGGIISRKSIRIFLKGVLVQKKNNEQVYISFWVNNNKYIYLYLKTRINSVVELQENCVP